jgi:hypothetical protein
MPLCGFGGDRNPLGCLAHLCSVTSTEEFTEFTEFTAGAAPRLRRTAFPRRRWGWWSGMPCARGRAGGGHGQAQTARSASSISGQPVAIVIAP